VEVLEERCVPSTVTNNLDDGSTGSLRYVLAHASNGDTINFSPSLIGQTIALTSGVLSIDANVTITGLGANKLTVSHSGASSGGVFFTSGNTVSISGLTISGATGFANVENAGTLTLTNCTVSGGQGGGFSSGVFNDPFATLNMSGCTISDNVSGNNSGGLENDGTATLVNCTITGNHAQFAGGISAGLGYASGSTGPLTLVNCTVAGNGTDGPLSGCGGIYQKASSVVKLLNTIVASNSSATSAPPDVRGTFTDLGHNLIGDTTGGTGFTGTDDLLNINPRLGPLQNNGGPTDTMALLPNSPAIDAGSNAAAPATDQRGVARPQDGYNRGTFLADIGAFEAISFVVTTTADNGNDATPTPGSLRQAIVQANATPAGDSSIIRFNIPASMATGGVFDLQVAAFNFQGLPALNNPVILDGTTQPSYAGTPVIFVDGNGAGDNIDGLDVFGGNSIVRGLAVGNFTGGFGIDIEAPSEANSASGNLIAGNWVGINPITGQAAPNFVGVGVNDGDHNTVGGTTAADRNVISGNGASSLPASSGGDGISVDLSDFDLFEGNYIGTNPSGTATLPNSGYGIELNPGQSETITGNLISGNGGGGVIGFGGDFEVVQGNHIGTDVSGTIALGNGGNGGPGAGIEFQNGVADDTIGGAAASAGNVIGGSTGAGIDIIQNSGDVIRGNSIGTDPTGTYDLGNAGDGITLAGSSVDTVGGVAAGAGNVIAFNGGSAVNLQPFASNPSVNDSIRGNSMFLNGGPGINFGDSLQNNGQAAPVISSLTIGEGGPFITYTVPGAQAHQTFTVDFYLRDPGSSLSAIAGKTYLGTDTYNSAGSPQTFFLFGGAFLPFGAQVVATATDIVDDTSPFSAPAVQLGSVFVWTGHAGDGSWTTPGNWTLLAQAALAPPENYPNHTDDVAVFPNLPPQTVTIPARTTITVGEIDFSSANSYMITALGTEENIGQLDFQVSAGAGDAVITDGNPPGTSGAAQSITAPITLLSNLDVTNTAPATLTLASVTEDQATVLTNVNNGLLAFNLAAAAGNIVTIDTPIPGSTFTDAGTITGTGALIKSGPGKLILTGNDANFFGVTTVQQGILEVNTNLSNSPIFVTGTGLLEGHGSVGPVSSVAPIVPSDVAPPPPPALSINNIALPVAAAAPTTFNFTVTLSAPSDSTVTVDYSTNQAGSAPQGDFIAASGTLTFPAGITTEILPVIVNPNANLAANETFFVDLANPTGGAVLAPGAAEGEGLIAPAGTGPLVSISNDSVLASATKATTAVFTVSLSSSPTTTVVVVGRTGDGSDINKAVAGSNYTSTAARLTFPAGTTVLTKTFSVPVKANQGFFADPVDFQVQLSAAPGVPIGIGTAEGVLTYDNPAPLDGVQPGGTPGILTAGWLQLNPTTSYNVEIDGPTVGTQYSQTVVTSQFAGLVDPNGGPLNILLSPTYSPAVGTQFTIVSNQTGQAVPSTRLFAQLPEGAVFTVNNTVFQITYKGGTDGRDIVLTVVPQATLAGPASAARGATVTYTLGALGAGILATTQVCWTINWNDGSPTQTVMGIPGTPVTHVFSTNGTFNVQLTAAVTLTPLPKATSAATNLTVTVAGVDLEADPGDPSGQTSALLVGGLSATDTITLTPVDRLGHQINVLINGVSQGIYAPTGHIIVYGETGVHTVQEVTAVVGGATTYVSVPALLFAGTGNARLDARGSNVGNALVGGGGTNVLLGGLGNDILIGGRGAATEQAGTGQDILIAGYTDYDTQLTALLALMAEWGQSASVVPFTTRMGHLNGSISGGLNGLFLLTAATTVHHAAAVDWLYSNTGADWFFDATTGKYIDRVYNKKTGDAVTSIPVVT